MRSLSMRRGLAAASLTVAAACGSDPVAVVDPATDAAKITTVDASAGWVYVDLATRSVAPGVTDANASTSTAWDVAFNATSVKLNGGASGVGGVKGYCLCQNSSRTGVDFLKLVAADQATAFTNVAATAAPADTTLYKADALSLAITNWYSYDPATRTVSAKTGVYGVRLASGTSVAKFAIASINSATAQQGALGQVTFQFAVAPSYGAPFGATQTATVDVSAPSAKVYYSLTRNAVTNATGDWDVLFDGTQLRLNGGVSGSGRAGALALNTSFAATGSTDVPPLANGYRADAFGGVFDAAPWYRYNLTGNNDITPTFDVYLVRRGATLYKLQLTSYYLDPGAQPRRISFRAAKIAG